MLKRILALFLLLSLVGALSCQKKSPPPPNTALVSVAPYIYFVQRIAGPDFDVLTLVSESGNPHIYEPKPKEIQRIEHASIWFRLGDPADQKVYRVLQERSPDMRVVELTQGIPLLSLCDNSHCHEEGSDLHLWLSPKVAMQQARLIAQGLIEAFPEKQTEYQNNLNAFLKELNSLDQEIAQMLEPKKGATILVSHPAFAYFCRDYGLIQLAIETEGKDPLPQNITEMLQEARRSSIKIVLLQPQYSNKGAELIAQELKIPTAMLNPYAQDYANNLRHLAQIIADS